MYTTDAYTPSDGNTPKGWVQMKNPARTISSGVFSDSNRVEIMPSNDALLLLNVC